MLNTQGDGVNLSIGELIALQGNAQRTTLSHHKHIRTPQSGNRLSKIKGHGIDFDEVREYQFGDDIRSIDWKTSAKLQKTYSKTYKEERERPVFILTDLNNNMFFGTKVAFKSVIAARLSVLIAHKAIVHQDKVGGVVSGVDTHIEFKPKAAKSGLQALIRSLVHVHQQESKAHLKALKAHQQASNTPQQNQLNDGLMRIKRAIRPGSLLFIVGDFSNFDDKTQSLISQISKHNDIVLCFIYDELEKQAPKSGRYLVNNSIEHQLLNTHKKSTKTQYQAIFANKQKMLLDFSQQNRCSLLSVATDDDLSQVLLDNLQ